MSKARERAVEGRSDVSRFVVHLTRDDTKDFPGGGWTAKENFNGIIDDRRIRAYKPHCLHMDKIPTRHRKKLSVCCFTEVPLSDLHQLTKYIPGRSIRLSKYGFVFTREFLISRGAQPALYVNSYGGESRVRESVDRIYDAAARDHFRTEALWRLLPYLNAMHERYDFTWEREWRVAGDLRFAARNLVSVILPENEEDGLKEKFLKRGIPVISPGWTSERIVAEFSRQARSARRLWRAQKGKGANQKRVRSVS